MSTTGVATPVREVEEKAAALAQAEARHRDLTARLAEADATVKAAQVRAAADAVEDARTDLEAARVWARNARRRAFAAQVPVWERQLTETGRRLAPQLEKAMQHLKMAADDCNRLIAEWNAAPDGVIAEARQYADIERPSFEGVVDYGSVAYGGGVRVNDASLCRQSPVFVSGGYVAYTAPTRVAPPPEPMALRCPKATGAFGSSGAHVLIADVDRNTGRPTGGTRCAMCDRSWPPGAWVPSAAAG